MTASPPPTPAQPVLRSSDPLLQSASLIANPEAPILDRRLLVFRPPALVAALQRVGRQLELLGMEEVARVELLPAEEAARFTLVRTSGSRRERLVSGPELGALLIAFCISAAVPLPFRANKTLRVGAREVTLELAMALSVPRG